MDTEKLSAVTAAVLADAAFEAVGEATKFSTQRYRETIDQIRQTGGLPPPAGSQIASRPPRPGRDQRGMDTRLEWGMVSRSCGPARDRCGHRACAGREHVSMSPRERR